MLQHVDDLRAHPVVDIEIRAHDADRERRRLPGQRLADSLGEHRIDLHQLIRVVVEHIADLRFDLGRAMPAARIDLHLELALVGRIRILAILRAPDLLGDALDAGNRDQPLGDLLTHARGFRERYSGAKRCVGDQIVLAKIRQQPRAEQRQANDARDAGDGEDGDQHARARVQPFDGAQLLPLAAREELRLRLRVVPRHHQHAHGRRRTHRDQQRQADGQQERDRQRPEKGPLQAGHHQDGQKRHRHRRGGVEHRPPHLERCAREQLHDVGLRARQAAPAQDVLHVDHRIVDHDAERDHQSAQASWC